MNARESQNLVNMKIVDKLVSLNVKYDKRVMFLFSKIYHKSGLSDILSNIPSQEEKDRVLLESFKLFCSNYNNYLGKLSKSGREILYIGTGLRMVILRHITI